MKFQTPQFIDIEDKIFGPLTIKQFLYVAGGGALCFIIYKILPFFLAIILILPVGGLAAALAFFKFNGQPFIVTMQAFITYRLQSRLYIWKKDPKKVVDSMSAQTKRQPIEVVPHLSQSRLRDMAWSLDVLEKNK